LDSKDAAIINIEADFTTTNSGTKLLPDTLKLTSVPPTINRLGTKIIPYFSFTYAFQESLDGTFPITKHHIDNDYHLIINLDTMNTVNSSSN